MSDPLEFNVELFKTLLRVLLPHFFFFEQNWQIFVFSLTVVATSVFLAPLVTRSLVWWTFFSNWIRLTFFIEVSGLKLSFVSKMDTVIVFGDLNHDNE